MTVCTPSVYGALDIQHMYLWYTERNLATVKHYTQSQTLWLICAKAY